MSRTYAQAGPRLAAIFALAACLSSCSPSLHPEQKLLGKWQSGPTPHELYDREQYEFLKDGTVVVSGWMQTSHDRREHWDQYATGTFHFIDPMHLKIDLGLFWGTKVYEVMWPDSDHLRLQAGDEMIELARRK